MAPLLGSYWLTMRSLILRRRWRLLFRGLSCVMTAALFLLLLFFIKNIKRKINPSEPIYKNIKLYPGEPGVEEVILLEGYGGSSITARMWCAVESAAHAYPDSHVTLLMSSQVVEHTPMLHYLTKELPNVRLVHLEVPKLFFDSPLQRWYEARSWELSVWPKAHFNDALKWLLLWRYGGLYLDLDVVVLKALGDRTDFIAGLESAKYVAAGVVKTTPGHPVLQAALEHFASHFDGTIWGANGPELLTQVLIDRCGLVLPSGETPQCLDVAVLPTKAFYPIPWWKWRQYVEDSTELSAQLINDPNINVLHMWNLHSSTTPILLGSNQPYAVAARTYCPITVALAGDTM